MVEKQIQLKNGQEFVQGHIPCLKELMIESDKVIIMGHKNPDMDAIGASIGILKVAQMNEEGYIVVDFRKLIQV